ncbi:MAG: tetratricopeptide repeat protein [Paludibacteraceae bacterium]
MIKFNILLVLLVLLVFFYPISLAQNTDSIIKVYRNSNGEYNVDSLLAKSKTIMFSNPDLSLELIQKTLAIAKLQNNMVKVADTYRTLGNYFSDIKGDVENATRNYNTADSVYRKHKGKQASEGIGAIYHSFGAIYQRQSDYATAIDFYTKALRVLDSIGNETIRPKTLNNLSTLYAYLKDNVKAEEYARECLKLSQKNKDNYLISVISTTLSSVLIAQEKYDEVPTLLDNAKKIALQRNDQYILDLVDLNYGGYYQFAKKDCPKAIENYRQATQYAQNIGNEYEVMRALVNLSESYLLNNQIQEAKKTAQKAYLLVEKIGSNDTKQRLLYILAKSEAKEQEYENAYKNLLNAYQLKDSVFNEENARHISYLETKYQTEKKELRISALEKEKKLYAIITFGGVFILLLLLFIVFLRNKSIARKKLFAEQKIIQLEQEKQLIATQAVLEGEIAERTRLARDLHDGLGGQLSLVKLKMHQLHGDAKVSRIESTSMQDVLETIDQAIRELRHIAHNLMPESLTREGLKAALTDFCNDIPQAEIHFFGTEEKLEETYKITSFRILQELVNNALKHAEATQIIIQIIIDDNRLNLIVSDNGKGFEPSETNLSRTSGLNNIKSRVNSLSGRMTLQAESGKGTEMEIEFQLINQSKTL